MFPFTILIQTKYLLKSQGRLSYNPYFLSATLIKKTPVINKCFKSYEYIYKPSSVWNGHLSTSIVTNRIQQPTTGKQRAVAMNIPTWSCSEWGLHSRLVTLSLVSSYLTFPSLPNTKINVRRYISVALSLESPPLGITQHSALWSSDFPHTQSLTDCVCDHSIYSYLLLNFNGTKY